MNSFAKSTCPLVIDNADSYVSVVFTTWTQLSTLSLTVQTLCQRCYYYVDTIVYLVIDNADSMSALLLLRGHNCLPSNWLCWHIVRTWCRRSYWLCNSMVSNFVKYKNLWRKKSLDTAHKLCVSVFSHWLYCTVYTKEYILVTERTAPPCFFQTFAHPTSLSILQLPECLT